MPPDTALPRSEARIQEVLRRLSLKAPKHLYSHCRGFASAAHPKGRHPERLRVTLLDHGHPVRASRGLLRRLLQAGGVPAPFANEPSDAAIVHSFFRMTGQDGHAVLLHCSQHGDRPLIAHAFISAESFTDADLAREMPVLVAASGGQKRP